MAQAGKVRASGLFIFIMLVLEKLWKPARLCLGVWVAICVNLGDVVPARIHLCVSCSSQSTDMVTQASWWAPVHCRQANTVAMSRVSEPDTETHKWLTMIEGCPFTHWILWQQLLIFLHTRIVILFYPHSFQNMHNMKTLKKIGVPVKLHNNSKFRENIFGMTMEILAAWISAISHIHTLLSKICILTFSFIYENVRSTTVQSQTKCSLCLLLCWNVV